MNIYKVTYEVVAGCGPGTYLDDTCTVRVVANSCIQAIAKARKIAQEQNTFPETDEHERETGRTYRMKTFDVTAVEREEGEVYA